MQPNDNDETNQQDPRDNPNEINLGNKLPEDHASPFSPPGGVQDRIDDTFQATDSNVDEHEHYDAGIEAASGVDMPGEAAEVDNDVPETEEDAA